MRLRAQRPSLSEHQRGLRFPLPSAIFFLSCRCRMPRSTRLTLQTMATEPRDQAPPLSLTVATMNWSPQRVPSPSAAGRSTFQELVPAVGYCMDTQTRRQRPLRASVNIRSSAYRNTPPLRSALRSPLRHGTARQVGFLPLTSPEL